MSAIIGIYSMAPDPGMVDQGIRLMEQFQRFPCNSTGTWHNGEVFLGCHAQWITPESVGERLPYFDETRVLAITADAIIDNRHELFLRLNVDHARRNKMTDSELILLAYEMWGDETPAYLVGDFCFLIWDGNRKRLFGARDFSGARTLYYYQHGGGFCFSTTIKPLLTLPDIDRSLNEQWLAQFLAISSMVDAADVHSTVYTNIRQLPPSHTIIVSNGSIRLNRYSTLPDDEKKLKLKTNGEYEEAFKEVFGNAISARLRTYREVGAHLSGGLDSGSIIGFAAPVLQKANKTLYTYSYVPVDGFEDWTKKNRIADERPYIQSIVRHVGNISDHYLSFEERTPYSEIDDWLDIMEMPYKFFANCHWLKGIFETAHRQGAGILLTGQRGNATISWGHAPEYQASLFKRLRWIRFYRELSLYSQNTGVPKSRIWAAVRRNLFPVKDIERNPQSLLINADFAKRTGVFDYLRAIDYNDTESISWSEFRRKHFEQLFHWNITGTYTTKLSLRYGLWDRDPTNDLRVIRFCLSIPEDQYVQSGMDRSLIRRATKELLPDQVRLNQRVRGIQGADGVHRMAVSWNAFIDELQQMSRDSTMNELINMKMVLAAIEKIKGEPKPELVYSEEFSLLIRSLIVNRFIKQST
ncbi:asparagine synthase-related protein [Paenibacillus sp. sgz302251]|uniref:asparagine synthase-related protein n=1 Tax=Paenibacillus sp. sgz302251 TaxID=3414493 RepID=UPI003C7BB0D0